MQFTKENAYALAEEWKSANNAQEVSVVAVEHFLKFIEENDAFAKPHTGRPKTLDRAKQVAILRAINEDNATTYSRFMLEQMVDLGLLEKKKREDHTGRGRKPVVYVPTGKGKSYLSLSKNWGL